MKTLTLPNGIMVLAKDADGMLQPYRYANRAMAMKKVAELGPRWFVYRGLGRPFYIGKVQ